MTRRLLLVAATICGTVAGVTRMLRNRFDARRVVRAAEDICVDAAYTTDPKSWPNAHVVYYATSYDEVLEAIRRWNEHRGER